MAVNTDSNPRLGQTGHAPVPEPLQNLNKADLALVEAWLNTRIEEQIEAAIIQERAGMDKLFASMGHAIKFIPNAISARLCTHYIEPAICARIAKELEPRAAAGIANHLSAAYAVQTCQYLTAQEQADLLVLMKPKSVNAVLTHYLECDAQSVTKISVLIAPATLAKLCKPALFQRLR